MSKDRIYLANITGSKHVVLPYSCGVLQSYVDTANPQLNSEFWYAPYIFNSLKGISHEADKIVNPSILGLSLYSWNWNRSVKLAKLVKSRYPDCLVVVGGPHVPDNLGNWLNANPWFDVAAHGEAEITWTRILEEFSKGGRSGFDYESIDGISWRRHGETITNKGGKRLDKVIDYSSPYLKGYLNDSIMECATMGVPSIAVWETNRGCPYSCTFCDWGSYTNQKIRQFNHDRLMQEIDYFGETINEIHIADANFGILPRDVDLARKLADAKVSRGVLQKVHASFAKNNKDRVLEIIKIFHNYKMSESGATLALQSMDANVLSQIKRQNISLAAYADLQREINALNIPNYTELILGLPEETTTSFLKTLDYILDQNPGDIRIYPLKLFPNAEIADADTRSKYKMKTAFWDLSFDPDFPDEKETLETVIETKDLNREDMKKLKRLSEYLEVLHIGKWLYYLAWHLRKEKGISIVDIYWKMLNDHWGDDSSTLGRLSSNWFFSKYNSGETTAFVGPVNPYNISWRKNFFRKITFLWLCVSMEREKFYAEVRQWLEDNGHLDERTDAILRFQEHIMLDFGYDPAVGKSITVDYNIVEYLSGDGDVGLHRLNAQKTYVTTDATVGNDQMPLKPNDPDVMFQIAGGDRLYVVKSEYYVHKLDNLVEAD